MNKNSLKKVAGISVCVGTIASMIGVVSIRSMDHIEASRREVTIAGLEEKVVDTVGIAWGRGFEYPVKVYRYQTVEGVVFEVGALGSKKYEVGEEVLITYYKSGRVKAEKINDE